MHTYSVNYDELEGRLDPHFYQPFFYALNKKLRSTTYERLEDVVSFSNETWNQEDIFDETFPYIEISAVDTLSGEIQDITYYEKNNAPSRAKMIVRDGDIIVSTTRPHRGGISLIDKSKDGFIASTGFAILRGLKTNDITRSYIYHFLRTSYALNQMLQRSSGGNYPAITTEELSKLIIPIPSLSVQEEITTIIQKAYETREEKLKQADELLNSIDDFVRQQLGIDFKEPEEKKIYVVKSQSLENNRQDPYYYNSKFIDLHKVVGKTTKTVALSEVTEKVFNGNTPAKSKYKSEGTPIVKVSSLKNNSIDWTKLAYANDKKLNKFLQDNDILLLSSAHQAEYLGKNPCLVDIPSSLGAKDITFVGELICIRPNTKLINPYYLLAVLRLNEYHQLINREKRGQTSHIYPNDIEKIKIPLAKMDKQNAIANEFQNRLKTIKRLKTEASELLKQAKKHVEELILD